MLLDCQNCGAPIDVQSRYAVLAKCFYCGRTQRIRRMTVQQPVTPPNWRPPQRWTPPQQARAPSVQMGYRKRTSPNLVFAIVIVSMLVLPLICACFSGCLKALAR